MWGGENRHHDFVNDMLILDRINLSWGKGSMDNAPTPRTQYGAILLPNQNIIYIGKQEFLFISCAYFVFILLINIYYLGGINSRPTGLNYDDMSLENALPLNEVNYQCKLYMSIEIFIC